MAGQSGYSSERLRLFALRTKHNHEVMYMFAGLVLGLVFLMVLFHLSRLVGKKLWPAEQRAKQPSFLARLSRKIRNVSVRKAPALPSMGHVGVVIVYVIINVLLTFVHLSKQATGVVSVTNLGSRTAWMTMANLVVTICLAVKNTPLSYIAWSYERINVLHQVAGGITFAFAVLHVSFYTSYFVGEGRAARLLEREEIFGMVAALCLVILVFSAAVVRNWWYELFYYMHIGSWLVGIVTLGLHQPEFAKKIIFIIMAVAGIWLLDRIVRLSSLALNSVSNEVTLHPLANGGTRVCVKKPPPGAVSGKHCFLWIPQVRTFETHPFTIAAVDPLEFVIASYDGFTSDLHRVASANPGVVLRGSVNGAYGTFPNAIEYDTVLLVAGGSGASFTFGIALNALRQMQPDDKRKVIFVWLVKHPSHFTWFADHLRTLQADSRVTVRLYVTRSPSFEVDSTPSFADEGKKSRAVSTVAVVSRGSDKGSISPSLPPLSPTSDLSIDPEKELPSDGEEGKVMVEGRITHVEKVAVAYERPDVSNLIHGVVEEMRAGEHALVMGCGPQGLMRTVRNTTASCIRSDGPAIELHCEEFGW